MADVTPAPQADGHADEPIVRAFRLAWSFDNLSRAELPPETTDDTVYYAERDADQAWRRVVEWLGQVPGSDVIVAIDEIPLDEWIGIYGGVAADVAPQRVKV